MRRPALPVPPRWLALGAILLLAVAVRFWGIGFGLPHTQARPDETQIIDVNLKLLSGNLKPDFFDYPWLYMWVTTALELCYFAVGYLAGWFGSIADLVRDWPHHWEPWFLINRGLSATLGTLTILVVYSTGRRLWDERTGLVAAFFMALAFIHVRDSHFGSTDAMMTFFIMLSTMWLVDGHLTGSRRSFVLAGVMGGLATATKYNAGVIMFPVLVSQIVQVVESRRTGEKPAFDGRMFWFGIPCAAAFLVGVPFLIFDFTDFQAAMVLLDASMRSGTGTISDSLGNGWWHHLRYSLYHGVGPLLLVASIAGAPFMYRQRKGLAVVLLTFPVIYFIVIGSVRNLFFRYAIPIVPFLCLLAAWAVVEVARRPTRSRGPFRLRQGSGGQAAPRDQASTWLLAAAVMVAPAVNVIQFDYLAAQTDNRVVVSRWFDANVPAGASIAQSGSTYGYVQFTRDRFVPWLWENRQFVTADPVTRVRRPVAGNPDFILLQDSPLPNVTQPEIRAYLAKGYLPVSKFTALDLDLKRERVYDLQDAFFIPFANFHISGITRPGPNFTLYKYVGQ